MASIYEYERRVEFADTDLAGIMHFANHLRFMESAEHAFLRSLGFSVHGDHDGQLYGWPRVHVSCEYRQPLRFEDRVRVRVILREKRSKSLTFVHLIYRLDGETETLAAVGQMTTVCVRIHRDGSPMKAAEIPALLAAQLEPAPPSAWEAYVKS